MKGLPNFDERINETMTVVNALAVATKENADKTNEKINSLAEATKSGFETLATEMNGVKKGLGTIIDKFKNMPLTCADKNRITTARNNKIVTLLGGKSSNAYRDGTDGKGKKLRDRAYSDLNMQIRREFGVTNQDFIKSSQTDMVIEFIRRYEFPYELQEAVAMSNNQMSLGEWVKE